MRRPLCRALAASLVAAACSAVDDGASEGASIADSAGVRIVTSGLPAPPEGLGLRVAAQPSISIGVTEGEAAYELAGVVGAARLEDGRILVANGMSGELRYYDAEGRYLRSVGRTGTGPGEFQVLWRAYPLPDGSVVAWDARSRRVSLFDPEGSLRHSYPLPAVDSLPAEPVGAFPDGSVLIRPAEGGEGKWRDQEVVRRDTVSLRRVASDGSPPRTVARVPGKQQIEVWVQPMLLVESSPFGRSTYVAVKDTLVYIADNERLQVDVHGPDGRLLQSIRAAHEPAPVTPADAEAFRASHIDEGWRPTYLAAKRRYLEVAPVPETKPAHGGLVVGDDGSIWLAEYRSGTAPSAPRRWRVFHAEGHEIGGAETPAGLQVTQVGRDFVLGIERDEAGVERVRLYRLDP